MQHRLKLLIISTVLLSGAPLANAASVTSLTIQDVGSGLAGAYSSTLDGVSGVFRFSLIDDVTFLGASFYYGDIAANPGPAMGEIDTSQANPILTFTTGFIFANRPFVPETLGPIVADISMVNGNPEMTVTELPFAGEFGTPGSGILFPLGPQASLPSDCAGSNLPWQPLSVHWVNQIDANHFNYKIGWSHCITLAESGSFAGVLAYWRMEGIATTAVPVPAAFWLLVSGLMGLAPWLRRGKRASATLSS